MIRSFNIFCQIYKILKLLPLKTSTVIPARSTSEEFSSGDVGRHKEMDEYAQPHARDKQNKNQEERDEGKYTFF